MKRTDVQFRAKDLEAMGIDFQNFLIRSISSTMATYWVSERREQEEIVKTQNNTSLMLKVR